MSLTIKLSDEQATVLQAKAEAEGLSSVEAWIEKLAEPIAPNPPVERPLRHIASAVTQNRPMVVT